MIHNENISSRWRSKLISSAKGRVLEVDAGTGNNLGYYPSFVSITVTDLSERMIQSARVQALRLGINAEFIVSSVENLGLAPQSFDTIISTFSLCGYENPKMVLELFNKWCKPDGRILLLEHGLSKWKLLRWFQKKWDHHFHSRSGCHMNRDIYSILEASSLRIVRIEMKMAGAVLLIWSQPSNPPG